MYKLSEWRQISPSLAPVLSVDGKRRMCPDEKKKRGQKLLFRCVTRATGAECPPRWITWSALTLPKKQYMGERERWRVYKHFRDLTLCSLRHQFTHIWWQQQEMDDLGTVPLIHHRPATRIAISIPFDDRSLLSCQGNNLFVHSSP